MKKAIILSVLLFSLIALAVAALLVSDYGYVLITSGDWTYENSLTRTIVIAAVPLILLYFALRGLSRIWRLPTAADAVQEFPAASQKGACPPQYHPWSD
jgi:uncharacterized protein HemY